MPEYGSGGGYTVVMAGPFASSGGGTGKLTTISAPVANWKGGTSPYSQVVAMDDISVNSKIDIQLSADQIELFSGQDIAFTVENRGGEVTLVAVGDKPSADCVFQATVSEVLIVDNIDSTVIIGNTVKTTSFSKTGGVMSKPINMNSQDLAGLKDPKAPDQAATMGFVNQQMKKAAPYNYAHNSDFTQFVAQAGVGGKHGNQVYAGDRWILDSGTVSGSARADGNGYHNIKLNGTIRQKVANAPDVANTAIEMISGTASISYNDGEITITSSGGIIKNVLLCTTEILPEYRPKGYDAELAECMKYHREDECVLVCKSTGSYFALGKTYYFRDMGGNVPTVTLKKFTAPGVIDITSFSTDSLRIEYVGDSTYIVGFAELPSCLNYDIGILRFSINADI